MNKSSIGIVEPDSRIFDRIGKVLLKQGYDVQRLTNAALTSQMVEVNCDLIIATDTRPDMTGSDLLDQIDKNNIVAPVIFIAEKGSTQQVASAIRKGACDYLLFSDDDEVFQRSIEMALDKGAKIMRLSKASCDHPDIVTRTPAMQALLEMAHRIASSSATVLIQGESGTGKELIARYIHGNSERKHHRFVAMNCAALPENLAESELFGHEKGAFTGAVQRTFGKFEQAHNGTLLLDEIGEMSLPLQAKLLRVLQEKEVDRIGGQKPVPVNVRVIATTHRDLGQMVAEERFRKDLFYRLRIIPLPVPPLRERRQDIELLVRHFAQKYAPNKETSYRFTATALEKMHEWIWPGNVRELENTIERAVLICDNDLIGPEYLLLEESFNDGVATSTAELVGLTVKELEERLIVQTLRHVNQNRTHAAQMLGISIRTLRNKLREYCQVDDARAFPTGDDERD